MQCRQVETARRNDDVWGEARNAAGDKRWLPLVHPDSAPRRSQAVFVLV